MKFPGVELVFKILDSCGGESRFIGGCVRDALSDKEFADIDIATTLLPEEVRTAFSKSGLKLILAGEKFGTIAVVSEGNKFEITTLRKDISCDGRHAEVKYTTDWEEDASRRDFTINAISCDKDGKIYDYFGGIEDLKNMVVKFIGDPRARIAEDHLRILRYFRFLAYFNNNKTDLPTLEICREMADKINLLSGERIEQEMKKLLASSNFPAVIEKMEQYNIAKYIFFQKPLNIKASVSLLKTHEELGVPWSFTLALLSLLKSDSVSTVMERWKLSNKERNLLTRLSKKISIAVNEESGILKILFAKFGKETLLAKLLLNCAKHYDDKETYTYFKKMYKIIFNWKEAALPMAGNDIIKAFKIPPGREVGILMEKAKDIWALSDFKLNKAELIRELEKDV
jgi:poly(A) polymerase